MNTTGTEYFDKVMSVTRQIEDHFSTVAFHSDIAFVSDHIKDLIYSDCRDWWSLLNAEVRNKFISQPESRLQDRFANYLIVTINNSLLPFYGDISGEREDQERQPYEPRNFKGIDYTVLCSTESLLHSWLTAIINNIKVFSPEVYAENKQVLTIPEYDRFGDEINNTQPEQTETGVKMPLRNLPPKILLLEKLGFFQLPEVLKLSFESKGKLVSTLCGGSADNAVDYIRHCDPQRTTLENNPYRNKKNVKAVEDLLNQLNKD